MGASSVCPPLLAFPELDRGRPQEHLLGDAIEAAKKGDSKSIADGAVEVVIKTLRDKLEPTVSIHTLL